jgi:hypothetical protein
MTRTTKSIIAGTLLAAGMGAILYLNKVANGLLDDIDWENIDFSPLAPKVVEED